jgi:hypothetical protein
MNAVAKLKDKGSMLKRNGGKDKDQIPPAPSISNFFNYFS